MAATFAALVTPAPVQAATFTVTNTNDSGAGSLRQAVLDANAAAGADTITFAAGVTGTIMLASTLPAITEAVTIDGPGAASLTISGGGAVSIFQVFATLDLEGLTVADGFAAGSGGAVNNLGTLNVTNTIFSGNSATVFAGGVFGGAIANSGTATVANSTFTGNSVSSVTGGGNGGGINNFGTLTVSNSTFSGNSASNGGGGIANSGGTTTVTDSSFFGNSALGGGGIVNGFPNTITVTNSTFSGNTATCCGGGMRTAGFVTITNSTFSENSASTSGGGLFHSDGSATITNSTFSENSATFSGGGIRNQGAVLALGNSIVAHSPSGGNCFGTISDGGGNLQYPGTDCGGTTTSADPLLDPAGLQDNGGPTTTIALQPVSPAIDAAVAANCPPTDQRGVSRPQGAGCDIGAFELEIGSVVINTNDSGPGSLRAAIEFTNTNPGPDTVVFNIPATDPGFNGEWFTIKPLSPLPSLTDDGTTIDGTTQTVFGGDTNGAGPEIELDGASAGSNAGGLGMSADDGSIRGLVINRFNVGLVICCDADSTGNVVQGNYIGTDATGTTALSNFIGLLVFGPDNVVGGTTAAARNVISGNTQKQFGIGGGGLTATGNVVQGNYIGTDVTGTVSLLATPPDDNGNGQGLVLSSSNNTIGGTAPGAGNLISGNTQGLLLCCGGFDVTNDNVIEGNYIGTDVTGTDAVPNTFSGVLIQGSNNTVGGTTAGARNVISGNGDDGITICPCDGPADNNAVQGNYIGTDITGTQALGNSGSGVGVGGNANTIGGATPEARNVISGNGGAGVQLASVSGNAVEGNYIGTDVTGTVDLGNAGSGVTICCGAQDNTIGGTAAGAGNVISGNGNDGVDADATGNVVQGNFIGTDATGTMDLGNTWVGLRVDGSNNIVGGAAAGAGNVISGNPGHGVEIGGNGNLMQGNFIGTDASGTVALSNGIGVMVFGNDNTVGGTTAAARNVISGNTQKQTGICCGFAATGNVVQGNYIGTDVTGTVSLLVTPPDDNGQGQGLVISSSSNTIGGTAAGAGNLISGNTLGLLMCCGSDVTNDNVIQGNFIGTDVTGTVAVPNTFSGVTVQGSNNAIGGTTAAARNVISGNLGDGITAGADPGLAENNVVQGNFIGTNASGTAALGNGDNGVTVGGNTNTIGGTAAGAGNVISGNAAPGVTIGGSGNAVEGNYIGTDASGTAALANAGSGVDIEGGSDNTIGGTTTGARNVISGNTDVGVRIGGDGHLVQGNFIGTDVAGTAALGNAGDGVAIFGSNNTIGGTATEAANTIAFNESNGVTILSGTGNAILRNSIFSNGGLGIDLGGGGVTPNDRKDADTGPNNLQNFPVLTAAIVAAGQLIVKGTIDTPNPQTVVIEIFANSMPDPGGDPSGFGEGALFLGSATPGKNGRFIVSFDPQPAGTRISATATSAGGDTSEFAKNFAVIVPP